METVPDELQMELIDLQNDTDLRNKFQNVDIHNFYQNYMNLEKFPRLGAHAKQIMALFWKRLCLRTFIFRNENN